MDLLLTVEIFHSVFRFIIQKLLIKLNRNARNYYLLIFLFFMSDKLPRSGEVKFDYDTLNIALKYFLSFKQQFENMVIY